MMTRRDVMAAAAVSPLALLEQVCVRWISDRAPSKSFHEEKTSIYLATVRVS